MPLTTLPRRSALFRQLSSLTISAALLAFAAGSAAAQNGAIRGKITEQVSGSPVGGAVVNGSRSGGGGSASTRSTADGSYTLADIPPGTYTVQVTAKIGLSPKRVDSVVVRPGQTTTLDFAMVPIARQLEQVVTTATGGAAPERVQDSPNSISVVSSTQIAERPAMTITDHLKAVPGLSISTGGIAQANIVSRGFNNAFSTQLLTLQDYRYANVPSLRVNVPLLFTGTDEDIDRIEVLQGPAAALYGPNSGNGVLHVITKSPFDSPGTIFTLDGGNRDMIRGSIRNAGIFANDKLAYKLSGEALSAHDFEYVDPNEPTVYPSNDTRIPVERRGQPVTHDFNLRRYSGEGRLDFRPSESTQLISTVGYSMIGNAREITTTFGAAEARNWSYLNLQERLHHKGLFAQVFYDKSNSGNDNGQDPSGTYYLRTGIPVVDRSSILAGQVQQGTKIGRTQLVFGGEYLATRPQTAGTINGRNESNDDINEYGGYLQSTTALTRQIDFQASARIDANSRITGSQFSPRAAIMFKPDSNNNFRVTFNRAYSSPTSFSFFLDQYSGQTPAPGMPVQILGNPPKEGWQFANDCQGSAFSSLCMRSPYVSGVVAASAAAAYPGFFKPSAQFGGLAPLEAFIRSAPASAFGPAGEQGRQALLQGLPIIAGFQPTNSDVGSVLANIATSPPTVYTAAPGNLSPLGATFSNTWEVGYKGFVAKRLGIELDAWFQKRPAEPTTQIVNPAVLFNGQALGAYLVPKITAALMAQGVPQAQAVAQATLLGSGYATILAKVPVGAAAFTSPLYDQPYLVFTYQNATGFVNVTGQDLSADLLLVPGWTLSATYSHLDKNVWTDAPGASAANPLTSNTPKNRASMTLRYENQMHGYSAELRGRYADAFPVNSGVFNSYNIGTPTPYPPVPVNAFIDASMSWVLPVRGSPRWSVSATNILDNRVPTFVGVPALGALVMTRIQYQY
jgi:outer membrane receptor for ferrienterochelin and colicins